MKLAQATALAAFLATAGAFSVQQRRYVVSSFRIPTMVVDATDFFFRTVPTITSGFVRTASVVYRRILYHHYCYPLTLSNRCSVLVVSLLH